MRHEMAGTGALNQLNVRSIPVHPKHPRRSSRDHSVTKTIKVNSGVRSRPLASNGVGSRQAVTSSVASRLHVITSKGSGQARVRAAHPNGTKLAQQATPR
jgi:hypothetical protein